MRKLFVSLTVLALLSGTASACPVAAAICPQVVLHLGQYIQPQIVVPQLIVQPQYLVAPQVVVPQYVQPQIVVHQAAPLAAPCPQTFAAPAFDPGYSAPQFAPFAQSYGSSFGFRSVNNYGAVGVGSYGVGFNRFEVRTGFVGINTGFRRFGNVNVVVNHGFGFGGAVGFAGRGVTRSRTVVRTRLR